MDLGGLPGNKYSIAKDLNSRGQVVGQSMYSDATGAARQALLLESGSMIELGTLGGKKAARPRCVMPRARG